MKTTHRDSSAGGARRRTGLALVLTLVVAASLVAGGTAWAQGKTITLSMLAGFKEDVLRANLPEFEKKTGIKVQIDAAPIGDLYKKQVLSLSSAARYDAVFMDEPWIAPLSEFLLPLTERARGYDMSDFVPTALAAGAFQGVQYALPVDPNMQLLVYRKDLFDQKGHEASHHLGRAHGCGEGLHRSRQGAVRHRDDGEQRHPDLPLHAGVHVVAGSRAGHG